MNVDLLLFEWRISILCHLIFDFAIAYHFTFLLWWLLYQLLVVQLSCVTSLYNKCYKTWIGNQFAVKVDSDIDHFLQVKWTTIRCCIHTFSQRWCAVSREPWVNYWELFMTTCSAAAETESKPLSDYTCIFLFIYIFLTSIIAVIIYKIQPGGIRIKDV